MRRLTILIICCFLLLLSSNIGISAQENNEVVQVVVGGDAKVILPYLWDAQDFLRHYNVTLEIMITEVRFIGDADELIPNAHLYITADANYPAKGLERVWLWLDKTAYQPPSPLIFVLSKGLSFDLYEVAPEIPDILASIIFYAIGDCDNALQMFATVENQFGEGLYWHDEYGVPHESNLVIRNYISFYWGNCALLNENYDTAITHYSYELIGIHNYSYQPPSYVTNLAWVYLALGDYEAAFDEELWEPYTDYFNYYGILALSRRAQLYALAFDYDNAIADMNQAIERAEENRDRFNIDDTDLAELYTLRGEIIFLIYEWDRVLENFNTALELDPDYAPAYFQRGVLYYTMTERENALADFEHYLELAPDGQYAEQAQQYIDSIQIELDALGG